MPDQPKVIAEFKECPNCRPNFFMRFLLKLFRKPYPPETLTQRACKELKEAGRIPKDTFTSLTKVAVPLTDPRVALSVETLLVHYDVCTKCGANRATRAEIIMGVVQTQSSQLPKQSQRPF